MVQWHIHGNEWLIICLYLMQGHFNLCDLLLTRTGIELVHAQKQSFCAVLKTARVFFILPLHENVAISHPFVSVALVNNTQRPNVISFFYPIPHVFQCPLYPQTE